MDPVQAFNPGLLAWIGNTITIGIHAEIGTDNICLGITSHIVAWRSCAIYTICSVPRVKDSVALDVRLASAGSEKLPSTSPMAVLKVAFLCMIAPPETSYSMIASLL